MQKILCNFQNNLLIQFKKLDTKLTRMDQLELDKKDEQFIQLIEGIQRFLRSRHEFILSQELLELSAIYD
ncbi:hypothetical protein pb186bvf_002616 [Paramecium bursaria]